MRVVASSIRLTPFFQEALEPGYAVPGKGAGLSVSLRTIAISAVAVFLGLLSVLLAHSYVQGTRQPAAAQPQTRGLVSVVVAARPLSRGTPLRPDMLKLANFPPDAVPAGAFHNIRELGGDSEKTRVILRALAPNEPVLPAAISGPGGRASLSVSVAPGMRAVSLRSNDVAGVGGFVLPGDRVDVLLTHTTGNDQNSGIAQVLAENVRVLGVDQVDDQGTDKPVVAKSITVEVTPAEAQGISLGQSVGTVSLSLRAPDDEAMVKRQDLRVSDLAGRGQPAHRRAPRIRIVRGTDVSFFSFDKGATK